MNFTGRPRAQVPFHQDLEQQPMTPEPSEAPEPRGSEFPQALGQINYAHWFEGLRAALSQSLAGIVLAGARPIPIAGGRAITSDTGVLVGYSLRNLDPANAAVVQIYDANETGGKQPNSLLLASLEIPAGGSVEASWSPGPSYTNGLLPEISGTTEGIEGSVWVRA